MSTNRPPFRADHVGSLLRPDSVKRARKQFSEDKTIDVTLLREAEDAAINNLVKLQESAGLNVVTDGETRRSFWHYDFMGSSMVSRSRTDQRVSPSPVSNYDLCFQLYGTRLIFLTIIQCLSISSTWRLRPQ